MGQPQTTEPYRDPPPFSAEVEGLALTLYPGGRDRLAALIDLIDGARRSLKLCFYIFACDATGRRVRDALTAAARRGVAVTLVLDSFGAEADAEFFAEFCAAGGDYRCFSANRTLRYLIRNHQKIVLADADRAMIGGFNVADGYFAAPQEAGWNDLGARVEGAAVAPLHRWFDHLLDWTDADGVEWRQVSRAVRGWDQRVGACRWLVGGPTRHLSTWARSAARDLDGARRLDLMMAYFSPPPSLLRRIRRIARRGKARLITAGESDNGATVGASRALYADLLDAGVEIHEFTACKMHTKLLVIDDAVYLGSANFDVRSLYINLEIMLRVEDAAFAERMRAFVAQHLPASRAITRESHRANNTLLNRLRWNVSLLLVSAVDYTVSRRLNLGL